MMNDPQQHSSRGEPPLRSGILQSKLVVLATLFVAAGLFGIPLLWINKRFSTAERIFWSVVVTLYTLAMLAVLSLRAVADVEFAASGVKFFTSKNYKATRFVAGDF